MPGGSPAGTKGIDVRFFPIAAVLHGKVRPERILDAWRQGVEPAIHRRALQPLTSRRFTLANSGNSAVAARANGGVWRARDGPPVRRLRNHKRATNVYGL